MMDIYSMVPKPDLLKFKKVLCVQPHPDDNEIGAGGTIALMHQKGIEIVYLTISKGQGGSNTLDTKTLVDLRQHELIAAGKTLGASAFYQLDLDDAHYPNERVLTEAIVEVIRKVKPDLVMTVDPYLPYEAHPTHRRTGMGVLDACLFASMKHFPKRDQPNSLPHHVQALAFYASAQPNTFIDVTSTFDLKLKAIAQHQTQFDAQGLTQITHYLKLRASLDGQVIQVALAERFKVLPSILTHMMVESEHY